MKLRHEAFVNKRATALRLFESRTPIPPSIFAISTQAPSPALRLLFIHRNPSRSGDFVKSRRFPPGLIATPRLSAGHVATTLALITTILLIVFSPLALSILDDGQRDWERLSLIGQSYGAISAVLAAAAVIGVALTLILQQRQMRESRRLAIRQFHTDLLAMAIDKPELLQAWGPAPQPDGAEPRLTTYTNLVLNYFVLLHQTGSADLEEIRLHLKFMATGEWARSYWESTASIWTTAYSGRSRQIVDVFAEELGRPLVKP
jgi:hypothetical protein